MLKDLVVDMTTFWEKYERVRPYLISLKAPPEKERLQSPEDRKKIDEFIDCILCACCHTSCSTAWWDKEYLGPAALAKMYRFVADSRGEGGVEALPLCAGSRAVRIQPFPLRAQADDRLRQILDIGVTAGQRLAGFDQVLARLVGAPARPAAQAGKLRPGVVQAAVQGAGQRGAGYRWENGEPFTVSRWNGTEPNDSGGEDVIEAEYKEEEK